MAFLKSILYGHMDKSLQLPKDACLALVKEIRSNRQLAEVPRIY